MKFIVLWLSEERSLNHQRTDYRRKVAVPVCAHSWQCNSHGFFILLHDPIWIGTWSAFGLWHSLMGSMEGSLPSSYPMEISQDWKFLDIWTIVRGIARDFLCCDAICTLLFVRVQSVDSCCLGYLAWTCVCTTLSDAILVDFPFLGHPSKWWVSVPMMVRNFLCLSIASREEKNCHIFQLNYILVSRPLTLSKFHSQANTSAGKPSILVKDM